MNLLQVPSFDSVKLLNAEKIELKTIAFYAEKEPVALVGTTFKKHLLPLLLLLQLRVRQLLRRKNLRLGPIVHTLNAPFGTV